MYFNRETVTLIIEHLCCYIVEFCVAIKKNKLEM